jgi:hypothetical protein
MYELDEHESLRGLTCRSIISYIHGRELYCQPGTVGCVAAQSPPNREAGSRAAGHAVHWSPPSRSGTTVHVAVPEPFLSGRRDLSH